MARSSKLRELEHQLKEIEAERDAFERDVNVYLRENQALKKQVEVLRSSHHATDSEAQNLLVDIRQKHKLLNDLRNKEHAAELRRKEAAFIEATQNIRLLEKKLQKAEVSLLEQNSSVDQKQAAFDKLKAENEMLTRLEKTNKKCLSKNEQDISSLKANNSLLNEKNKEQEAQIISMNLKFEQESELSASKARIRIRVLEDQIRTLKANSDKKTDELAKAHSKLADRTNEKEAAVLQRNKQAELEQQLRQVTRARDALKENLSQSVSKVMSNNMKSGLYFQQLNDQLQARQHNLCDLEQEIATEANDEIQSLVSESETSSVKQQIRVQSLEGKVEKLNKENQEKATQLCKVSSKLSDMENDSQTTSLKLNLHSRALETKVAKLEAEIEKKDERLCEMNLKFEQESELSASKARIRIRVLEDQIRTLKANSDKKTDELAKAHSKLADRTNEKEAAVLQRNKQAELEQQLRQVTRARDALKENLSQSVSKVMSNNMKSGLYFQQLNDQLQARQHNLCDLEQEIATEANNEIQSLVSESETSSVKQQIRIQSLEGKVEKLNKENQEKATQLCRVSSKLSDMENDSQTTSLKLNLHSRALETKVAKLEAEIEKKDERLCEMETELHTHKVEVTSESSQQKTLLKTLEEKLKKLEGENQNKEEQLYKVSSKLAHAELESDSVASSYRVKLKALEQKIKCFQNENQQKEEMLIKSESSLSQAQNQLSKLKDQIRRIEMENARKEEELKELRSLETEMSTKTSENMSKIQNAKREKSRLEVSNARLKSELDEASRKISSLECDLADAKCSIKQKERQMEKVKEAEKKLKGDVCEKESEEESLRQQLISLQDKCDKLKNDLQIASRQRTELENNVLRLNEKLNSEQTNKQMLKESSSLSTRRLQNAKKELESQIGQQANVARDLETQLERTRQELHDSKEQQQSLQEKCTSLENDTSRLEVLEDQLRDLKKKCSELQAVNSAQSMKHENLLKENREMKRQQRSMDSDQSAQSKKVVELEKTSQMLKESCVLLEKQVMELETFNNELIEKQETVMMERDEALKKGSSMDVELRSMQHQMKNELFELDQNSTDQITELKIQLRNEMNQAHEITEEHRDLERRYRLLELNAAGVQRKLTAEKDCHERTEDELSRVRSDVSIMQQSMMRLEQQLRVEIDRCDSLEKEKTQLINRTETDKLEHSHELVRLNCTGAQQIKLIDFLQSRVEELEPLDKKKKKKKPTVYQAPLQYTELRDLLEQEKTSNVKLQEQVNMLRSELQASNSKVKRMKHGMDTPLSPGTVAAISSIVKSPAPSAAVTPTSKVGKLRSKPRMHHNIPHRLSTWLCTRATRCSVCLAVIHFGHSALRCSECSIVSHTKCRKSVTNTCGLPGGLFEQFKEGAGASNLSPITCVFKGSSSDQLHGYLKVLCGDDSWTQRNVRLTDRQLRISPPNVKSPSSKSNKDDVIDLTQAAYIHTEISQLELPSTANQDLPYVFKIQTGSSNSCWPARSVYFLPGGFTEKHQWVQKLESIAAKHNQSKNITANAKIYGNEILTLLSDEKLEMNCSLPISDKLILLGCDEGLFLLAPSTSSISSRANMTQVEGVSNVFQMLLLSKSNVVAIEGSKHRLVSFTVSEVKSKNLVLRDVGVEGCHVVSAGHAEGVHYLCVASATAITILKYNDRLKKFCPQKEIATTEPCTCMLFTACSVIIGTNTFYEIDLTAYKVDEFLNIDDVALSRSVKDESIFPVSVLKIKDHNGRQEFLLCFHEFGLFVDGFGHLTRPGQLTWSRMPLSFEYREPYLVIVQFNSVEIIQLDVAGDMSAEHSAMDHAFLSFPSARYLGPAITDGAVYLCSTEGSRTSVFCCKGSMKAKRAVDFNANKRRYVALSSSVDSLASPTPKRSYALSDKSNLTFNFQKSRLLSASCESMSDTSQWTTEASDYDGISLATATESEAQIPSNDESFSSDANLTEDSSTRMQWRPVRGRNPPPSKPARRPGVRPRREHNPVPSSEV